MIKPLNKRVLCRPVEEPQKGILLLKNEINQVIYDVLAVADDINSDILKIGDRIMIEKYFGQDVEIDGENLSLVPIDKILGVFYELPIHEAQ